MTITNHYTDMLKQLKKELQPQHDEEKLLEGILHSVKQKFSVGQIVTIKDTGYTGVVTGFNECLGGFYPGVRYPIFVKITKSEDPNFERAVGCIFEYSENQVKSDAN